ncbi:LacI family transcriptional regulator [Yoonia vestfoldensis]|uniref:LacI family transcriptional regulator n=1 Tax=Yoonia vestfoldensis TaxID=245188 RepID=UPI00037FA8A2|nr:LacI family transcriptional regulator [Yoonia vestfoldensis]
MAASRTSAEIAASTAEVSGKPTLKTIARISGLAVPTVSRALNDAPDIGHETKKLIRKIASDIGYVPNRAGVRLRTGRTNVISLVMSTEMDLMSHTARLISSVAGALRDTPYHLIVTPYFPDQDAMEPVRYIVETGSADAIILNQIRPDDPRVNYMMDRHFPFATHGRTKRADLHPYYDFDNQAFGTLAAQRLIARGRKHILLIAPPTEHNYAQHMIAGVSGAAREGGIDLTISKAVSSDNKSAEVVTFIIDTLTRNPDIDAVIVGSTTSAMAAVSAIEQCGKTVGKEVDVFAKEAVPFLKLFRADILTLSEKIGIAGEFLAKAAIQAIRNPDLPPMQALEVPSDDPP